MDCSLILGAQIRKTYSIQNIKMWTLAYNKNCAPKVIFETQKLKWPTYESDIIDTDIILESPTLHVNISRPETIIDVSVVPDISGLKLKFLHIS